MSPLLSPLLAILLDASDPDEPDTPGRTAARLVAGGWTPNLTAVDHAVAALTDLRALDDGADPHTVVPGMARSPWLDPADFARQVLDERVAVCVDLLSRRGAA